MRRSVSFRSVSSSHVAPALSALALIVACSAGGGEDDGEAPPPYAGLGGSTAQGAQGVPTAGTGSVTAPVGNAGTGGSSQVNNPGSAPVGQGGAAGSGGATNSTGTGGTAPGSGTGGSGTGGSGTGGSAGTSTGGSGSSTPNAACPNLLLCDDFEGAAVGASPDPARWSLTLDFNPNAQPSANIAIDNTNPHGGAQSVRVAGNSGLREIVARVAADRVFVRAFMRLSEVPTGGGPVIMAVGGDQNADIRLRLWAGEVATINTPNGDSIVPGAATSGNCPECLDVPSNDWFCAEMFVDNAQRSTTIWINGSEAGSVVNNNWNSTWPTFPTPTNVRFGYWGLQGAEERQVWIDDVAVGTERVGCN
jgi:hypothetical protein